MSATHGTTEATAPGAATTSPRWRPRPNPVLRRELVERWRGRRAFVVATVYLGILTAMMVLLLWAATSWLQSGFMPTLDPGPTLGRFLLENVFGLVLLLVLFVGPGYAAAQISQERERRTLGLLQITLVSPWRIVTGKLGAASAWLLLLVLLAAPMAAAAFFLGGVTVGDLLRGVAYLAVITVAVAALGIGISSVVRRTVAAVVLTYGLVMLLVGGTIFGAVVEMAFQRGGGERPITILANPFVGLADAVRTSERVELPSILTPFTYALPEANRDGGIGFGNDVMVERAVDRGFVGGGFAPPGVVLGQEVLDQGPDRHPVWLALMALYAAAGLLALLVAARRVTPGREPRGTGGRRRRDRGPRELAAPAFAPPPPPAAAPLPPPTSTAPPPPPPGAP